MTMQFGRIASIAVALSGCGQQVTPAVPAVDNSIVYVHPESARISLVEDRFETYALQGMSGLIRGVQSCYDHTVPIGKAVDIRDCLAIDYMAFNITQDAVSNKRLPEPSFFKDQAFRARLSRYALVADFNSVPVMIEFLRNTYKPARTLLSHNLEARRYEEEHREHYQYYPF